ncbi:MAG: type III pantothenate kinase [Deltaproteobacteria bacterium]|nr:type III pantothenate kinase [Deltaproteobacteria bacterium]
MLLVLDIGNTSTTLGLFKKEKLLDSSYYDTHKIAHTSFIKKFIKKNKLNTVDIKALCLSSVTPHNTPHIKAYLKKNFKGTSIMEVSIKLKTGLKYNIQKPRELGADRIANAVQAFHKFRKDVVIIDFGTATTFDYVSKKGVYEGGIIYPGIQTSFNHLFKIAQKLEKTSLKKAHRLIGKNTEEHIHSGFYYGYISLVEGLLTKMQKEIGKPIYTIATGGFAELLAGGSKKIHKVDPYLTLHGICKIYQLNT